MNWLRICVSAYLQIYNLQQDHELTPYLRISLILCYLCMCVFVYLHITENILLLSYLHNICNDVKACTKTWRVYYWLRIYVSALFWVFNFV